MDVPVLVLTTEDDVDSKMAARDGSVRLVVKPVDPDVLVELASELLNEQPGA